VKLGFVIQNQGPDSLGALGRLAPTIEALGYDSVWLTDHVVGMRAYAERGYTPYWLECLTGLAFIAAQTKTIRLGTSILVLPVRDPVYTAKVLATLDNLSGGRLNVGIGTGWSKGEFYALGRGDYHENRGHVTNESLKLILRCWEGGEFEWTSEYFTFRYVNFDPVPLQKPRPPILVGGPPADPVIRRIKMFEADWHPFLTNPAELARESQRVNEIVGRAVRVSNRFLVPSGTSEGALAELIAGFREAGCDELVLDMRAKTVAEVAALAESGMRSKERSLG
jgi:probable F420-dependent oxidoreductase